MELPKTFKAARFEALNTELKLVDMPLVLPAAGELLVKVLATGICHSDESVKYSTFGNPFPMTPGHESIGDVVAVGPGEAFWKVGDRVGAPWHGGHDGTCRECKRGAFQVCQNGTVNGIYRDGGYAEFMVLRREVAIQVPATADPASVAPLLCAGVTVFGALRRAKIPAGGLIGVQGIGGLGHLAIQYASKMGYQVVAISSSSGKEKFAKDLGASFYIDESKENAAEALQKLGGAAGILATAPNPTVIGALVNGLQPLGRLIILAAVGDISINTVPLVIKGLEITGWPTGAAIDCEEAIEFAENKGIQCLIDKFPLSKAPEAFEHSMSGKSRFRTVLIMD